MTPYADEGAQPWSTQHTFAPPRLPAPRSGPNDAARYSHHEAAPLCNLHADTYDSSRARDVRSDVRGRQHSFASDADRVAAEPVSLTRPPHYTDEPTSQYAAPSPSLAAYARTPEIAPRRMRAEIFEHDEGAIEARSRSFRQDPSQLGSSPHTHHRSISSSDSRSQDAPYSSSLSVFQESRTDRFQSHYAHAPPQHQDERMHSRRPSLHAHVAEHVDAGQHRAGAEPFDNAWTAPRHHPSSKRPLPQDHPHPADAVSQPPAVLSRPSGPSGPVPHYPYEPSLASQARPTASAASHLHDRHLQARDAPVRLAPARNASVSDGSGSSHPPASVGAGQADATMASHQHSLQPNRKRLRISRACDECRRRKTRCDIVGAFPGEPGHPLTLSGAVPPLEPNMEPKGEMLILQPCMNCRRSGITCTYSKRPLKRGPSKGYIKDLERRLNSLESQIVSGDRIEGDADGSPQDTPSGPVISGTPQAVKPKARTEDRISRLETVLARPSTAKSEEGRLPSTDSSRRSSQAEQHQIKTETPSHVDMEVEPVDTVQVADSKAAGSETEASTSGAVSSDTGATSMAETVASVLSSKATVSPAASHLEPVQSQTKGKGKANGQGKRRSAASSPSGAQDADIAEVKRKVVTSFLHATFPIVPACRQGESSRNGSSSSNIARLEDRVLVRGMRLLNEPVEMATAHQNVQAPKTQTHAARVASLIGQASAGLGGPREELIKQTGAGADTLRALRKVAHRLSGQEADLLMLCHLDHLRNGRNNNSALAAAVSKLGSGSHIQNDRETYRRRTLLFMLDRWHAVSFGTPHLLAGRFGVERQSFRSMKEALGDVSQLALGDGVYEVLRGAIMLGQLNDLVQNNGGWKGISKSDVDAVIHSAMDDDERPTTFDPSVSNGASSSSAAPQRDEDGTSSKLLSTAALRYSLENLVRCYHALHTLPNAKDATLDDLHRMFNLAESVVVLGTAKTPISLQGKLVQSAIGPSVLAVAGVGFSWCLRIICMMVANSLSTSSSPHPAPLPDSASSAKDSTTVSISPTSFPLEFYRRKILDYVRMCGPFCLFSGGPPTCTASFAPVYLRLALHFNSTVSFASQLGSLVSPQSRTTSPVHQDATALGNDADNVLDMAREMGFLGYVLAGTTQDEAWKLLTGGVSA
ncbi:hypothetical protein PHSY_002340 [Pseudozyma hubeiensis SY62]|uniref:Zn(2)-C6 fungal-type domain-containing protein n=1 Tax=Pseudozyma hubeiensis (strain SY62) TaxID=1305764 RepID=R9P0Z8_PSEHS|nr:hypothetical protein PHSY_002340 [Pseudozyma hubeiensis SY62]GAC94767.1 hypothetical protein PHSY_002340 [Pseudozyma hubeiensis SY62]